MTNTRANAWNTNYNNGASWMTNDSGWVDVYSNGSTTDLKDCSGNTVSTYAAACKRSVNSIVAGAENQCVELFNRLYLTKGWISSTWTGNGNQLYNIATLPTGFGKEDNTHTTYINPGDAITFDDQNTGHVVMVDYVEGTGTTRTVHVVSQNTQGVLWTVSWNTSTRTLTQTYLGINYGVQGIIHRPATTPPPTDTDGDGVPDTIDICPTVPGPAWNNGCPVHFQAFAADFNGDHIADIGLRDANTGTFYIKHGPTFADQITYPWAQGTQFQPFAAKFDADGYADIGLRDMNAGTFFIKHGPSFADQLTYSWAIGTQFQPFAADFDGNGLADIGLRDKNNGIWYIKHGPTFGDQITYQWASD